MGRSVLAFGLSCLAALAGVPECFGQGGAPAGQVLVIHPGIYHIWFDQEPSQEVIDRFTQIFNAGKTAEHRKPARVIRATSIFKNPETGQYEEKPVWLLNFHWDRMILSAAEHGIPVYVTVEDGVSMYEAEPRLRSGLFRSKMSEEAENQVKHHAFSGGTYGSKVNEQRIIDVHLGVIEKHPNALVQTFIHSQSGDNYLGALISADPKTRRQIAQHLGTVCLWDPALTVPLGQLVAQLPLAKQGYELVKGRPLSAGEEELTRTDPPDEQGKHYLDRVNAGIPELARALEGVRVIIGWAEGTVSQSAVERAAMLLGAERYDPKQVAELAGNAGVKKEDGSPLVGVKTFTGKDGAPLVTRDGRPAEGDPWVLAVENHNFDFWNDFVPENVLGVKATKERPDASKFNPAYTSEHFRNCVTADMGGAVLRSDGEVDGSTARADRLENIPVWDGAQGTAEFIASETVRAMHGSAKGTVVIDPAGNEALARQVGSIIESQGGRVVYAEGLDDAVSQTVAGRQMTAAVLRLAEKQDAGDTADTATLEGSLEQGGSNAARESGTPVRLQMNPDSLLALTSGSGEMLHTTQLFGERRQREPQSGTAKPLASVSVYAGSVPIAPAVDAMKEEGWTVTRVGGSNWLEVQHESWDSSELVLDGSDMSSGQIVDAVRQKLSEIDDQDDKEGKEGEKSGQPRKVVVGGDPDDPKVREVIEQLSNTDDDGDGKPDVEVVFVNCKGMSRRQAVRAVARAVRRHGAALGVAIVYVPREDRTHTPEDEPPVRLLLPKPIPPEMRSEEETRDDHPPTPGGGKKKRESASGGSRQKQQKEPPPLVLPPEILAETSQDPVGSRLAKIQQEISQSAQQPHLLDLVQDMRAAQTEPPSAEPPVDWEYLRFDQSQLLVRVREIEEEHLGLFDAVDELDRWPEGAVSQAERQAWLSRIEREHARLQGWLDWSVRQVDLEVHPSSLRDQLGELKRWYEEVRQSLEQVAAGPATREQLDDLRGRMTRLHWTHDTLRESLVDNLEWINARVQQASLRQQMQDLHRELATAQASLLESPGSGVAAALSGRIANLQRSLTDLDDALAPHPSGFQPPVRPERLRDLHAGVSRLQESLRGGHDSLSSTAFEADLYRLEQLAAKTQGIIRRNHLAVDPVALHDRMADLAGEFRTTQELLKKQTGQMPSADLQPGLASLSANVARINLALEGNAVGMNAPLLGDDLRQLQRQLFQARTFLDQDPARITPAAFQAHATGLNDMMTRTQALLAKAQSAIRPLAVEHGLIGLRSEAVAMERLLRQAPGQITPSVLEQHAVRLEGRLAAANASLRLAPPEVPTASLQSRLTQLAGELTVTKQLLRPGLTRLSPTTFEGPLNQLNRQLTGLGDPLTQVHLAVQPVALQSRFLELEDKLTHIERTLASDFSLSSAQRGVLEQKMEMLRSQTSQMRDLASHDLTKMQRPELQQHFSRLRQDMLQMRQDLSSIAWAHQSFSGQSYLRSADNMLGGLGGIPQIEAPGFSRQGRDTLSADWLTPRADRTPLGAWKPLDGNLRFINPLSVPLQGVDPLAGSYRHAGVMRYDLQQPNIRMPVIQQNFQNIQQNFQSIQQNFQSIQQSFQNTQRIQQTLPNIQTPTIPRSYNFNTP